MIFIIINLEFLKIGLYISQILLNIKINQNQGYKIIIPTKNII